MLIHLLQITFFNEYILSPQTWLHDIKNSKKTITVLIYLSFFYYLHYIYIIITSILCFFAIITLPISFIKIIKYINLYLLCALLLFNIVINGNNIKLYFEEYKETFFKTQNINNVISLKFIPVVLIRSIFIPITCSLCLKLLFWTTKYEDIILYAFQQLKFSMSKKIIFIITISAQFILVVTQKISLILTSIELRNMEKISIIKSASIYSSILIEILTFSDFQIKRMSYNLHVRKIHCINFLFDSLKFY